MVTVMLYSCIFCMYMSMNLVCCVSDSVCELFE